MTHHSPKTGALMAYESGALSSQGRARVERHLRGCVVCQRELRAIQAYEATVDAIRDDAGPELDWSKMELALEREAQVLAKKNRRGWVVPAIGVALAAAAALVLALPSGTPAPTAVADAYVVDRQPPRSDAPVPSIVEDRAPITVYASAEVTAVAGTSAIRSGEAVTDAAPGARLTDDDVLTTTETSALHARLSAGVLVALEPRTELRLASLDPGDGVPSDERVPAVTLVHGRLATRIAQERTVFLAGAYRIEAEVASFVIDFDEASDALVVDVREGEVHVTGPGTDTRLSGPGRFPGEAAALAASTPVTLASADTDPTVRVTHPGIVRWQIGDLAIAGADRLAMRIGVGPATLTGWDARGRMFRAALDVGPEGLDLSPDDLQPVAPRVRQGVLAREDVMPVIRAHVRDLQRCYEHELRATPTLSVHVTARISVEMTGSVADDGVSFTGDEMPPTMARCMTNQIQTWLFPAPDGGPVVVPVPFGFEAH